MTEEDIYNGYNSEDYIHFRYVETGQYEIQEHKRKGKTVLVRMPILEKQKINFEDIKKLSLDKEGMNVPTYERDFTLVHNYLMDFWGAIMGSDAVMLYLHLKRYCYGRKDYCFPSIEEIAMKMNRSRSQIKKTLKVLEQYGFIVIIYRTNVNQQAETTPLFKVRRYIPLLTQELIDQLPDELRQAHDKYIADTQGIQIDEEFSSESIIKRLLEKAELVPSKSKSKEKRQQELIKNGKYREYILSEVDPEQNRICLELLQEIRKRMSKPSFDTWFSHSLLLIEGKNLNVIVQDMFAKDWVDQNYIQLLEEITTKIYGPIEKILTYTYNDYIKQKRSE